MSKQRFHFNSLHIQDKNIRLFRWLIQKMGNNWLFSFEPNTLYTFEVNGKQFEFSVSQPIKVVRRKPETEGKENEKRFEFIFGSKSTLGEGTFGTVKKSHLYVKMDENNKIYSIKKSKKALKFLMTSSEEEENELKSMLLNEELANKAMHSKAQSIFFGHSKHSYTAALVMKYISGADLLKLMENNPDFGFHERLIIANAVKREISRLHSLGFIHHDLKLSNFLFNLETGTAYLVDFGLVNKINEPLAGNFGALGYLPPELLRIIKQYEQDVKELENNGAPITNEAISAINKKLMDSSQKIQSNVKHDYYAYGVMLEKIFSGENCYKGASQEDIQSIKKRIKNFKEKEEKNRPANINNECESMEAIERAHIEKGFKNLNTFITAVQNLTKEYTDSLPDSSSKKNLFSELDQSLTSIKTEITNTRDTEKNWATYLKRYNKVHSLYAKIDDKLIKEAKVFRPTAFLPNVAKIASKLVTPLSWVAGLFSDKYKRYDLIRTESANVLLNIENEFQKFSQQSHPNANIGNKR